MGCDRFLKYSCWEINDDGGDDKFEFSWCRKDDKIFSDRNRKDTITRIPKSTTQQSYVKETALAFSI
jgi:hypothetical protein